jgi:hypothetical protein
MGCLCEWQAGREAAHIMPPKVHPRMHARTYTNSCMRRYIQPHVFLEGWMKYLYSSDWTLRVLSVFGR